VRGSYLQCLEPREHTAAQAESLATRKVMEKFSFLSVGLGFLSLSSSSPFTSMKQAFEQACVNDEKSDLSSVPLSGPIS